MPYIIKKFKDGYKVCKKEDTNECFSNDALPLENAVKQKKAIEISEHMEEENEENETDSNTDNNIYGGEGWISDSAIIKIQFTKKPKSYQKITIHTRTEAIMREFLTKLKQVGKKLKVNIDDNKLEIAYIAEPNDILSDMEWYEMPEYVVNPEYFKCPYIQIQVEKTKQAEPLLESFGLSSTSTFLWYPDRPKEFSKEAGKVWITTDKITPKYPIYIISVGRWEKRHTSKFLEQSGIDYKIVVEPAQADEYKKVIDPKKVLVLPQNYSKKNKGGIPARNFVWEHSKKAGDTKHWILDDNIDGYERFNKGERTKCYSGVVFRCIEDYVDRYTNIKMAGHNYHMFGSSKRLKPIIKNTRIYSSILLSNDLPFCWRGRYNEDTDLSLRILKAGYATALFDNMLANKLATMTTKGGNTDSIYGVKNAHFLKADSLRKQHPDVAIVKERFGRIHHYVNYSGFKDNHFEWKKGVEAKLNKHKNNNYTMKLMDKDKFFKEDKNQLKGGIKNIEKIDDDLLERIDKKNDGTDILDDMTYLKIARLRAQIAGYDPKLLKLADDGIHKLEYNGTKFGQLGYNDFITYMYRAYKGDITQEEAFKHRKSYLNRALNMRGNWKSNRESSNSLATSINW